MAEIMATSKKLKDHHHHYTIESAKIELIKAKERVQELENIIKYLQLENNDNNVDQQEMNEEGENNNNDDENPPSTLLHSSSSSFQYDGPIKGNTLQVTMSYLCIKDILSCNQVCKQWNFDVSNNYLIWKQAAINQSPIFMEHMITKEPKKKRKRKQSDGDGDDDGSPNYVSHYKNIALGLIYDPCISPEEPVEDDEDILYYEPPKPKLSSKDVILLIDAIDPESETIVASWSKSLSDFDDEGEVEIITRYDTELHKVYNNYPDLSYSVRCFRCDTGQSICFMFNQMPEETMPGYDSDHRIISPMRRPTGTAVTAKDLWWYKRYIFMDCRIVYHMSLVLPSDANGSETEAAYKLDEMFFGFRAMMRREYPSDETDWYYFNDMDEILLSLEGLVWK